MSEGDLITKELHDVEYRDYYWMTPSGHMLSAHITNPVKLSYREFGETHRVVDGAGSVYIVPAPPTSYIVYRKTEGAELVEF